MKKITLDSNGRIIIEDEELLSKISGGEDSLHTSFSTNSECKNLSCPGSTNTTSCSNIDYCRSSNNISSCKGTIEK